MDRNEVASETLRALDEGRFVGATGASVSVAGPLAGALAGVRVVGADELARLAEGRTEGPPPAIEVLETTTQAAAHLLVRGEGRTVGVLAFATADAPGGGFLAGGPGQEEDLCLCSGWYRCLERAPEYHALHRATGSAVHGDHAVVAPAVPFFRLTHDTGFLETWFPATVVGLSAPNARLLTLSDQADLDLTPILTTRVRGLLALFRELGLRTLVLGAWGCGHYGNDPRQVATVFRDALRDGGFGGAFDRVVFAVADPRNGKPALAAFQRVFAR